MTLAELENAVLTHDVPEHALRAGDSGTVRNTAEANAQRIVDFLSGVGFVRSLDSAAPEATVS